MSIEMAGGLRSQYDPLVSIVVPVRNDVRYIERCLQSIFSQGYQNIEVVIVDGVSTDGTLDILRRYKEKYPEKICLMSEPDNGGGDAWNKGLKLAKGDIFGIVGSDDLYKPGAIEAVVAFFRDHQEASFVHGSSENIDENGNVIFVHRVEPFNYHDFANTARHIDTTAAFYRGEVIERIGWLDSSGDDFDVMLRIAREFKIYSIDRILSQLTIRKNSAYNSPGKFKDVKEQRRQTYLVSRKYGGDLLSPIALRYYAIVAMGFLRLGFAYPLLRRFYKTIRTFYIACSGEKTTT